MKTKSSVQWLDAAKTVLRIESDRALAKHFEWDRNAPSQIRSGAKYLNNTEAANIADVLQVNPLIVIADAEAERAKDDKTRLYWANAAKKFAGIAAGVLIVTALTIPDSRASSLTMTADSTDPSLYYVKCTACVASY